MELVDRTRYLLYKLKWYIDHRGKEFKGMKPACYSEWWDNVNLAIAERCMEDFLEREARGEKASVTWEELEERRKKK